MSAVKRFAEEVSEIMGDGGEITADVMKVADLALICMGEYGITKEMVSAKNGTFIQYIRVMQKDAVSAFWEAQMLSPTGDMVMEHATFECAQCGEETPAADVGYKADPGELVCMTCHSKGIDRAPEELREMEELGEADLRR